MKKLHQIFFNLLLLFLPTQLGKHFWPTIAHINGLRIDYYSPTIYLTDLLIFFVLFFFISEKFRKNKFKIKKFNPFFLAFFLYLFINSILSSSPPLALYKFLKILEFFFFGFYLTQIKIKPTHFFFLSLSIFYTFILALLQFLHKSSLGFIFYWLGERTFNLATPGIARIALKGEEILRPYATLPHPNALAGFVLIALLLLLTPKLIQILEKPLLISALITLFLSFSRSAWFATLIFFPPALLTYLFKKGKISLSAYFKPLFVFIGLIILIISLLSPFVSNFTLQDLAFSSDSLSLRIKLNQAALSMARTHPFIGVGLNHFILSLPNYSQAFSQTLWLQPVHNLYLLIASETGLIGLCFFLIFFTLSFKKSLNPKSPISFYPLLTILFLGLFDHYFFTLQQTQLLFTLALFLPWSKN